MTDRDPAAARFWMIQLHRLAGMVLVVLGAMVVAGRLDWPTALGPVLMIVGMIDFFLVPLLLSRFWKTREP